MAASKAKAPRLRKSPATPIVKPPPKPVEDGVPQWARDLVAQVDRKRRDDPGFATNTDDLWPTRPRLPWDVHMDGRFIWRSNGKRRMTADEAEIAIEHLDGEGKVIPARGSRYPWPRQTRAEAMRPAVAVR